jgi:molybdenum cofactor biosynthesis enzyme MoaA
MKNREVASLVAVALLIVTCAQGQDNLSSQDVPRTLSAGQQRVLNAQPALQRKKVIARLGRIVDGEYVPYQSLARTVNGSEFAVLVFINDSFCMQCRPIVVTAAGEVKNCKPLDWTKGFPIRGW